MEGYSRSRKSIRDFIRKNFKTSQLLALSFLLVILVGTILLSLPISQTGYEKVTLLDALFTATTSTCVTGLMTVNASLHFNLFGQIVILCMIQIGGLGLMIFIALIMLFINGKLDLSNIELLKDAFNKDDSKDVSKFIQSIIKYTIASEFIGFLLILSQLFDGTGGSVFKSLFLAISSFCNAGIEILGTSSLMAYDTNVVINLTVCLLIVLGGLGFIVWFDLAENLKLWFKLKYRFKTFASKLKIHTKIVLIMTLSLILLGAGVTLALEYNNVLSHLGLYDKIQASFFNSVTLRTAGFYTIDNSLLRDPTKVFMSIFMVIGASPGGTGGGLKTTTLFVILLSMLTEIKGKKNVHVFNYHITHHNIIKAMTICGMYVLLILFTSMVMSGFEPQYHYIDILFEITSAIGTVGLSTGITPFLTSMSKIILILLMFIGRVGPVTILISISGKGKTIDSRIKYPSSEIIVG